MTSETRLPTWRSSTDLRLSPSFSSSFASCAAASDGPATHTPMMTPATIPERILITLPPDHPEQLAHRHDPPVQRQVPVHGQAQPRDVVRQVHVKRVGGIRG